MVPDIVICSIQLRCGLGYRKSILVKQLYYLHLNWSKMMELTAHPVIHFFPEGQFIHLPLPFLLHMPYDLFLFFGQHLLPFQVIDAAVPHHAVQIGLYIFRDDILALYVEPEVQEGFLNNILCFLQVAGHL